MTLQIPEQHEHISNWLKKSLIITCWHNNTHISFMIKNLVDYFPLHAETLKKKTSLSDLIADEITANSQEGLMSWSIFQETVLIN